MKRQLAKRATKRWLEGAPDYVLACFYHPGYADPYLIVFGGKDWQEHTHGRDWLHNLSIGEGGVGGSGEFLTHEFAAYRYSQKHRKVRWRDIPLGIRLRIRYWAETPMPGQLTPAQITKIGAEENSLLDRVA